MCRLEIYRKRGADSLKALIPIFRGRTATDPANKDREDALIQGIEKCEISLHDKPNKIQCRLVVKMFCTQGIRKIWRLQYEERTSSEYTLFEKSTAPNKFKIQPRLLKVYMEHFGPRAEHLDILSEEGMAFFTSFTERIADGNGMYSPNLFLISNSDLFVPQRS